jgi:hypothetical protein
VAQSKPHSDESQLSSSKHPARTSGRRRRPASFSYSHSSGPDEDSLRDRQRDLVLRFRANHPPKPSPLVGKQDTKELKAVEGIPSGCKRLYELWPGKNRFYCGGRCMTGPASDRMSIGIAWALHGGVGCVYFALAAEYLAESVTMLFPLCTGVLFLLTIVFYALTAYADPGIIPRKEVFELFGLVPERFTAKVLDQCHFNPRHFTNQNSNQNQNSNSNPNHHSNSSVPQSQNQNQNQNQVREQSFGEERKHIIQSFKYCTTCHIFRPPRASHCA